MVTMCTETDVQLKAGSQVSSSLTSGQYITLISGAEAYVNTESLYNWTDSFSSLNADVQGLLTDITSSKAAIGAINYDNSGYTQAEAINALNVNYAIVSDGIKLLRQNEYRKFVVGA